jgi:hypothetical protein
MYQPIGLPLLLFVFRCAGPDPVSDRWVGGCSTTALERLPCLVVAMLAWYLLSTTNARIAAIGEGMDFVPSASTWPRCSSMITVMEGVLLLRLEMCCRLSLRASFPYHGHSHPILLLRRLEPLPGRSDHLAQIKPVLERWRRAGRSTPSARPRAFEDERFELWSTLTRFRTLEGVVRDSGSYRRVV